MVLERNKVSIIHYCLVFTLSIVGCSSGGRNVNIRKELDNISSTYIYTGKVKKILIADTDSFFIHKVSFVMKPTFDSKVVSLSINSEIDFINYMIHIEEKMPAGIEIPVYGERKLIMKIARR